MEGVDRIYKVGVPLKMSFVQVRERSGSGLSTGTADRTPFYGIRIPDEVKGMLKAIKGKDGETIKRILKCNIIYNI